ncbi:MAG: hypothetical protein JNM14_02670 [Ferruginibacter sp.]|nr:hypothetical protein [Ferruginibacter sp.]
MPLEIKELQVNVTVNDQQQKEAASATPNSQESKDEKKAQLQQCIDTIMDIMNSKKER